MDYHSIVTIQPGKRGGRPCIRGLRIAVADVLGWLAAGMSQEEILSDYPELTVEDIRASLAYALGGLLANLQEEMIEYARGMENALIQELLGIPGVSNAVQKLLNFMMTHGG
jgi:uncharacterized protein (DUF433 family)